MLGIKPYTLARGKRIYKGVKEEDQIATEFVSDVRRPVFFGFEVAASDQYGVVTKYYPQRDFKLVNLMDTKNLNTLYHHPSTTPAIQTILRENFGYNPSNGEIGKRFSVSNKDAAMATFLCEQGYDGYVLPKLTNTDAGGTFHPELAICRDQDHILPKRVIDSKTQQTKKLAEYATKRLEDQLKPQRTRKTRRLSSASASASASASSSPANLFGSPPRMFQSPPKKSALFDSPPAKKKSARLFSSTPSPSPIH